MAYSIAAHGRYAAFPDLESRLGLCFVWKAVMYALVSLCPHLRHVAGSSASSRHS